MNVVLIDHQDSFTFNLVHALGAITGRRPEVRDSRSHWWNPEDEQRTDLLVLGPGPGHPEIGSASGRSLDLIKGVPNQVPVFGVCFGLQLLVVAEGGKVIPARAVIHGKSEPMRLRDAELFRGLPASVSMMRYHSLVADRKQLPKVWSVTATDARGDVMAIRHVRWPRSAVQFHPESVGSPEGEVLLRNVIEGAARWRLPRGAGLPRGSSEDGGVPDGPKKTVGSARDV